MCFFSLSCSDMIRSGPWWLSRNLKMLCCSFFFVFPFMQDPITLDKCCVLRGNNIDLPAETFKCLFCCLWDELCGQGKKGFWDTGLWREKREQKYLGWWFLLFNCQALIEQALVNYQDHTVKRLARDDEFYQILQFCSLNAAVIAIRVLVCI